MEFDEELPAENIPGNQNVQNHQQHRRNQRLQQNVEALMHLANNNVIHALGGQFLIRNSKWPRSRNRGGQFFRSRFICFPSHFLDFLERLLITVLRWCQILCSLFRRNEN